MLPVPIRFTDCHIFIPNRIRSSPFCATLHAAISGPARCRSYYKTTGLCDYFAVSIKVTVSVTGAQRMSLRPVEKRRKQSLFPCVADKIRDCFVASLLAMTSCGVPLRQRNPRTVIASGAKQSRGFGDCWWDRPAQNAGLPVILMDRRDACRNIDSSQ